MEYSDKKKLKNCLIHANQSYELDLSFKTKSRRLTQLLIKFELDNNYVREFSLFKSN